MIINPFNIGHDYRKISFGELLRQEAVSALETKEQDLAVANNRARCFMRDLFAGKKSVQCQHCGKVVQFKNDRLVCGQCGKELDRIEYIEDYHAGRWIKTEINVPERTYALLENTP